MQIKGYSQEKRGYIKDGELVTNFILDVAKIINEMEGTVQYQFQICTDEGVYRIIVSPYELNKRKFLQKLPVLLKKEEEFYKGLRETILGKQFAEDEILYQTGRNGLQKVNEKWLYVCSNGYIDKEGFHTGICSGLEGAYIPETAVIGKGEERKIIESLFQVYNRNCEIFYPLFLTNIMAITNAYFREIGEANFMKITIWIDGASGSGKTELAKAAGTYVFSDSEWNRELISATGKRRDALKHLAQSSGSVYILDDVKSEPVRERRNSVKNIVDDCLRSVFQGQMTDSIGTNSERVRIDSCAVITGEYLDTMESQNARMFYLKADGFLKEAKNSRALYVLQKNPIWLTKLCIGYIRWLLKRMEENSFPELLKEKLEGMREEMKYYAGINNAERLNENQRMLEMAAVMTEMYFRETGMPEDFLVHFMQNAKRSIQEISDNTFCLLDGERMVVLKALRKIFDKAKIRRAYYEENRVVHLSIGSDAYRYKQEHFWININEDFVWIDDYKESLEIGESNGSNQYDENPCLIIREKRLIELFKEEIENMLEEGEISSLIADKVLVNLLKILREMQIIYKQYRSDNKWGRPAINYPVYSLAHIWREYEENCWVSFESVIQLNTWHPCIATLKDKMDNEEQQVVDIEGIGWRINKDRDEIYGVRKAFTNNKSLYRK
ncbi:MAG TPA: hypothetical protein DCZ40_14800 [Lachnospiraceae bacterium]|nr:hypothetical protein [Lachnospiraceae bacterium]